MAIINMADRPQFGEQPGQSRFMRVAEVAELLDISESQAYKIMRRLNAELAAKGKIVNAGRVSRKYLMERVYG